MNEYINILIKDLYTNVNTQINLGNKLLNYRKGTIVLKRRNNEDYYYLSYRDKNKVKSDYLGKLTKTKLKKIHDELEDGLKIKNDLKKYQEEEKQIRKLLKAIDKNILKKNNYEIIDLIVILRPILKAFGLKKVYLFGSYATGENDRNSDINIACDVPKKPVKELISKIEKETGKKVNIVTPNSRLPIEYLQNIDEEKLLIYGGY